MALKAKNAFVGKLHAVVCGFCWQSTSRVFLFACDAIKACLWSVCTHSPLKTLLTLTYVLLVLNADTVVKTTFKFLIWSRKKMAAERGWSSYMWSRRSLQLRRARGTELRNGRSWSGSGPRAGIVLDHASPDWIASRNHDHSDGQHNGIWLRGSGRWGVGGQSRRQEDLSLNFKLRA